MNASDLRDFFRHQLESVRDDYIKDLEAMSAEALAKKFGGKSRSALDMTFEVGFVNRRVAARLRGEAVEPWDIEGFLMAPEGYSTHAHAVEDLRSSVNEVIAAWDGVPEEQLHAEGDTSPVSRVFFVAYHTGYHDAQLNYIQSILGDEEVHWG